MKEGKMRTTTRKTRGERIGSRKDRMGRGGILREMRTRRRILDMERERGEEMS